MDVFPTIMKLPKGEVMVVFLEDSDGNQTWDLNATDCATGLSLVSIVESCL